MTADLVLALAAVALMSALVAVAVKRLLDAARRDEAAAGDLVARASRAGSGGSSMPGFLARSLKRRRALKVRAALPDALDMVTNSLSAGLTLPQAVERNIEHFPPVAAEEFARVIYDTRLGFSVGGAFDNLARRLPIPDVLMVVIATKIGAVHGGNLADSYRMLSALLRDNLAFEAELRAMTTEGRMQAIVMSVLPFAMIVLLGLVRRELVAPLFTTGAGWATLGVLCAMQGLAFLWIRKIVDIRV